MSHLESLLVRVDYKKITHCISQIHKEVALGKVSGNKSHFNNIDKLSIDLLRCVDTDYNKIEEVVK